MDLDVCGRCDVNAVDEPDPVRLVLHDHRARADAVAEEPDAAHQRAVGDAGRREDDAACPARRSFERYTFLKSVIPIARQRSSCSGLLTTRRAKISPFRQRIAAAGQHAFRRAAGAHHRVDAGADHRRGDAGRQVAVADQPDAGAGRADVARSASRGARRSRTMTTRSSTLAAEALRDRLEVLVRRARRG